MNLMQVLLYQENVALLYRSNILVKIYSQVILKIQDQVYTIGSKFSCCYYFWTWKYISKKQTSALELCQKL